jgi:hypothetical protein
MFLDKLLHFLCGYLIAYACRDSPVLPVLIAGIGKETLDAMRGGLFDVADLAFVCLPLVIFYF